ncbi:hypothetical protein VE04_04256 [Pseudogymnoascus sp. 24MN13]|nr:hypothetical protein VE04_04256 [Pseudogymnoascus sp. 24MN13]
MLFNSAAALLSLAALVSGAPRPESGLSARSPGQHLHSRHVQSLDARAVVVVAGNGNNNNNNNGNGRNNDNNRNNQNNRNNNDINNVIISTTVIQLSDTQRQQEVALIVVVQDQVRQRSGRDFELRQQKDRIRQNQYGNKNRNAIRANNNQPSDVTVIVADSAITLLPVGVNQNQAQGGARPAAGLEGQAAASAAALAAIQTVDPNAPFLQTKRSAMAPAGQAFPSFAGVELDPARIVEEGAQGVAVSVV